MNRKQLYAALESLGFENEGEYYKPSWNADQFSKPEFRTNEPDEPKGEWNLIVQWQDASSNDVGWVSGADDDHYESEE